MNAKAKGNRTEHKTIALLEREGYRCTRAAASLGVFDIVAVGLHDVLLCQVKSNRWPGSAEMEAIRQFPAPPGVRKVVYRWVDRQLLPDIRRVNP